MTSSSALPTLATAGVVYESGDSWIAVVGRSARHVVFPVVLLMRKM
jgi:hypothetical protein